ncbi:PASTA domain-containing protein [Actinoplanes sp. NPDC020271]|uniref:PASTA domain-containing protein n=1 Tax=Actinoplanes sp. NPDC020271 TaxID=3363896 RepID=UPI0037AC759C
MPDERQPGEDETRPMRAVDGNDDATRVQPNQPSGRPRSGDTPTQPMSPAGEWDPWTGRASVRPPRPEQTEYTETEWTTGPEDEEPSGRWWMPIVVGIVALVLLGLLGFGIYLIVQNSGGDVDTPQPTPAQTRATTTVTIPATTEPTTEPPVSTAPTTDPATTEATVPALRGMPLADAEAALARSGLGYRVIKLPSDAEPGTVIDCDPAEGQLVPPDSKITLVVAAARTGGPTSTTTAPAGGASTEPDGN